MARVHGTASSGENLSGNLNFYTIYLKQLDITATGNILDQSQQNFDDICNLINLVSQPVIMNDPIPVDLTGLAPTLVGPGMVFKFAVEHGGVFARNGDAIAVLKEVFYNVNIDGVALDQITIEFEMSELL